MACCRNGSCKLPGGGRNPLVTVALIGVAALILAAKCVLLLRFGRGGHDVEEGK